MYSTVGTPPDLPYSVCILPKYEEGRSEFFLVAMKRVLKYISRTKQFGLRNGGQGETIVPIAYSDADWADDIRTRKSMTGSLVRNSGAAVFWMARQQEIVALPSPKAEYISLCARLTRIT